VTRSFKVCLGPLEGPIDEAELDMMLAGLGEMGAVSGAVVDNIAGGSVVFEVLLEGAAADLESVLALVVPPEQIAVETLRAPEAPAAGKEPPRLHAVAPAVPTAAGEDEFFVDPAEFRRRSEAARPAAAAAVAVAAPQQPAATQEGDASVDLFITPDQF